jgi:NTE family protein
MTIDAVHHVDLVMEGGGIRGIALVGALAALEARGYRWVNLAGTSAGAIVAALAAAGYTAAQMREIFQATDFTQFLDAAPRWLPPFTRAAYNLVAHWGLYKGDRFLAWMRGLLADKQVATFGDLKRGILDRRQAYPLRVVASDVTRGRMLVLPQDIAFYGIDPDALGVAQAVRMSMSIPGLFRPVTLNLPAQPDGRLVTPGDPCYIVDGCLLSNFPLELFDGPGMDQRPTFGIRLTSRGAPAVARYRVRTLLGYVLAMFGTATGAADAYYLDTHKFYRTIEVDNLGISPTRFDLGLREKDQLYQEGGKAAREFLETWDFDCWKAAYAQWAGLGRRALLAAALEKFR